MKRWLPWLAVVLLSVGACKSTCAGSAASSDAGGGSGAEDVAYVATSVGLVRIDSTSMRELDIAFPIPEIRLAYPRFALLRDGTLYMNGPLRRIRGDVVTTPPSASVDAIFTGVDGKLWFESSREIYVLEGDTAGSKRAESLPDACRRYAVAGDGVLFGVACGGRVVSRYGEAGWAEEREATRLMGDAPHAPDGAHVAGIVSGPKGEVFVVTKSAVLIRDPKGEWSRLPLGTIMLQIGDRKLRDDVYLVGEVGSDGTLPVLTAQDLRLLDTEGNVNRVALPVLPASVTTVALDGSGRIWLGGIQGLHVLGRDGAVLQHWAPGVLPDAPINIAVRGRGPKLIEKLPAAVKGRVRGTLLVKGEPLANAELELGPESGSWLQVESIRSDLPDDQRDAGSPALSGRIVTKTNAQGGFVFEGVPRQFYDYITYPAGSLRRPWRVNRDVRDRCCVEITEGDTIELGEISVP